MDLLWRNMRCDVAKIIERPLILARSPSLLPSRRPCVSLNGKLINIFFLHNVAINAEHEAEDRHKQ